MTCSYVRASVVVFISLFNDSISNYVHVQCRYVHTYICVCIMLCYTYIFNPKLRVRKHADN